MRYTLDSMLPERAFSPRINTSATAPSFIVEALAAVIEPRVEELFSLVHQVIRESGYEELLSSGIVLTGGSAELPGVAELAEDIFLKPVRVGRPVYSGGLADVVRSPRYATAVGLLEEARLQRLRGRKVAAKPAAKLARVRALRLMRWRLNQKY